MRKLTLLLVAVTLLCGVVVVSANALCHLGSDGGSCDVVSLLRGGARLVNGEICQAQPKLASCAVAGVAGLDRK